MTILVYNNHVLWWTLLTSISGDSFEICTPEYFPSEWSHIFWTTQSRHSYCSNSKSSVRFPPTFEVFKAQKGNNALSVFLFLRRLLLSSAQERHYMPPNANVNLEKGKNPFQWNLYFAFVSLTFLIFVSIINYQLSLPNHTDAEYKNRSPTKSFVNVFGKN